MESISAVGKSINPMMIMLGTFPKGLNDGIWIAVSELGYTNDVFGLSILMHKFGHQTASSKC